jgi:FKBP-type peptidyl-prolyl cis-trans isomerase SlyD
MFMGTKFWGLGAVLTMLVWTGVFAAEKSKDSGVVKDGTVVSLQYTLFGEDGKTIESNKGKEPLKYVQGQHMMIPGLEKELAGMKVGQEKHVEIKPEDAYGRVDPGAVLELPKEQIPAEAQKVGTVLTARGPQGQSRPVKVKEVKEKTVVLDTNHPMAGKTLVFDVKVLDIQPFTPPQKAQPSSPPAPAAKPTQPGQPK